MPVLEMALFWADVYHGLRRCLATENRTVATQLTSFDPPKKSRHRRRQIGRSHRRSRHSFGSRLTVIEESDKSEYPEISTSNTLTASLTSCEELSRLEVMPATSSDLLKRKQRLQDRSLVQNAQDVAKSLWSTWWHASWPTLMAVSMQVSFGSSCLCHSLMGLYEEEEFNPPIVVIACTLGQMFRKLCKQTDMAISSAGSGPVYRTTSPTMELIDIREFFQQVNNALVEYLLSIPDSERSITE